MALLSICVPTFNREPYLAELLDAISRQWSSDLEITVADNASTDGTESLVKDYARRLGSVRYFRWSTNQGADRNYLKAVELAEGKYCWLVGSDDVVAPGAITLLLESIRTERMDIILFNRLLCSKEMLPIREDRFLQTTDERREFHFEQPGELERYLDDAKSICATFSYLSSTVFQRARWAAVQTDEAFIGTAYVHVHKLLEICKGGARLLYINRPLVNCRIGNDSFRELGLAKRVLLDLHGYSTLATRSFDQVRPRCGVALRRVMLHEYPFGRVLRYQGIIGSDPDWPQITALLRSEFAYPTLTITVATLLGRLPWVVRLSFWMRDRGNKKPS